MEKILTSLSIFLITSYFSICYAQTPSLSGKLVINEIGINSANVTNHSGQSFIEILNISSNASEVTPLDISKLGLFIVGQNGQVIKINQGFISDVIPDRGRVELYEDGILEIRQKQTADVHLSDIYNWVAYAEIYYSAFGSWLPYDPSTHDFAFGETTADPLLINLQQNGVSIDYFTANDPVPIAEANDLVNILNGTWIPPIGAPATEGSFTSFDGSLTEDVVFARVFLNDDLINEDDEIDTDSAADWTTNSVPSIEYISVDIDGDNILDFIEGGINPKQYLDNGDITPIDVKDGQTILFGTSSDEIFMGEEGPDFIFSRDGNDTIYGEDHNDYINGGSGDDILYGGTGNDLIVDTDTDLNLQGGTSNIDGGDGLDTFLFTTADVITSFFLTNDTYLTNRLSNVEILNMADGQVSDQITINREVVDVLGENNNHTSAITLDSNPYGYNDIDIYVTGDINTGTDIVNLSGSGWSQAPGDVTLNSETFEVWTNVDNGVQAIIAIQQGLIVNPDTSGPTLSGSGTSSDPYLITNLDELAWLSTNSSLWDKYFEQTNDIDASATSTWNPNTSTNYGFSPIGNSATPFTGSYNGNSYTIYGLTIDRDSENYIGLFGSTIGSVIRNLGVTNVTISGDNFVGGLVGVSETLSEIVDCHSTGSVTGSNNSIGGLVGANGGSFVVDCYSTVSVTGVESVGGLVGYNWSSTIRTSYSSGTVHGINQVGGLVGFNNSDINNSYSIGDVNRISGTSSEVGAFCGNNNNDIEYCFSTGSVYNTGATDKGFVGHNDSGTYNNNFWDSEVSNQTSATGATGKTSDEMKTVSTFTNWGSTGLSPSPTAVWDFETNPNDDVANNDYWDMKPTRVVLKENTLGKTADIDDGYPFLSWQNGDEVSLPVELTSFTVENTIEGVLCKWATESELENLGFILERRVAGGEWNKLTSYKTDVTLIGQGTTSAPTNYVYLDQLVEPNSTYEYRLADVDYDGVVTYHSTKKIIVGRPPLSSTIKSITVLPAYPNPFNPSTRVTYGLDKDSKVEIQIYDISGKLIDTLLKTHKKQGWHTIEWNGTDDNHNQVPAGVYLGRISANNIIKTTKLMLLK